MKKFLVGVYSSMDGKKIEAIKNVRSVFGIGLIEAKNFVEQGEGQTTSVILNAEQVAAFLVHRMNTDYTVPQLSISSIRAADTGLDFSGVTPF